MIEVCHSNCNGICEEGNCEIKVPLGNEVSMRKMASLIIEMLGQEEIVVINRPKGRLLNALLVLAGWLGIKVSEGRAP